MKLSRTSIIVLSLTLITLISWLGYQVLLSQKKGAEFESVDSKYTQELQPDFDPMILEKLEKRSN